MSGKGNGSFARKIETSIIKELKFQAWEGTWAFEIGDTKTAPGLKTFTEGELLPDFKNAEAGYYIFLGKSENGMPAVRSWGVVPAAGAELGPKPNLKDWPKDWGPLPKGARWQPMLRMHIKVITPTAAEKGGKVFKLFTGATSVWNAIGQFWVDHCRDQQDDNPGKLRSMMLKGFVENTEIYNPDPNKTIYSPVFKVGKWIPRPEDMPDEKLEAIDITSIAKPKDTSGKPPEFAPEEEEVEARVAALEKSAWGFENSNDSGEPDQP